MDSKEGKFYTFAFLSSGVQLKVDNSKVTDTKKAFDIILEEIENKKIDKVNFELVREAIEMPAGEPVIIAPPQPEPVDGAVEAKLSDDGNVVLLRVDPPRGKGKPVGMEMVLEAIKSVNAGNFFLDTEKIDSIIITPRIREYTPVGERIDQTFVVDVSKDHFLAFITLKPPFGGREITEEDVIEYLKSEHIIEGIKIEIIKEMIEKKRYNTSIPIAEGKKPVHGQDAELEFFFEHKKKKPRPKINDEGDVDFFELGIVENVKKGDSLAKKTPATPGDPGVDVYGNEIQCKGGKDIPSLIGPGAIFSTRDTNLIIAAVDGQPKYLNNKICIMPVYEVRGDVDFSVGNINFVGDVLVRGNVLSGFKVKAMGDIQIFGNVEAAYLESSGSITIKRGIIGQDKAIVSCRGDFFAKFVHNTNIYCEGSVYIEEEILYSKVNGFLDVIVGGKGGAIIGGVVRASRTVSAKRIGTQIPVLTKIEVGGSPSLREELEEVEKDLSLIQSQSETLMHSIASAKKSVERQTESPNSRKDFIVTATKEHFSLLEKIRRFKEKKEDLEVKLKGKIGQIPKVHVSDKVFSGTHITIKDVTKIINDEIDAPTFYESEGEVLFRPYEGG